MLAGTERKVEDILARHRVSVPLDAVVVDNVFGDGCGPTFDGRIPPEELPDARVSMSGRGVTRAPLYALPGLYGP